MIIFEVNQQIKDLKRSQFYADDLYVVSKPNFLHNVWGITYNEKFCIKSLNISYEMERDFGGCRYFCINCGDFLILENSSFKCLCFDYESYFYKSRPNKLFFNKL